MENPKQLGIYMDHAHANIMDVHADTSTLTSAVESELTTEVKQEIVTHGESHLHNKENHLQTKFYKKLADIIVKYDEVLLFGPTQAKNELINILSKDHLFSNIKMESHPSDKLHEHEQKEFVLNYFKDNK